MHRAKAPLIYGSLRGPEGPLFHGSYTFVCCSAASKADVEKRTGYRSAEAMRYPKSCRKKETGRLGPASGASVEMRLHRSLAPLNQEIVRAQFTSVGCVSRQPELTRSEAGMDSGATVGPVADSVQWFQLIL